MALSSDPAALRDAIVRRARELWELRGRMDGHAQDDWLQAEAEIMGRITKPPSNGRASKSAECKKARIVMRVEGVTYTGEYDAGCESYRPGDFRKGQPVEIRFTEDKMYIKCLSGRELETRIVERAQ